MTRHEAKELILSATPTLLQRDRNGKGYICPICGSGSGKNGTGITTKDGVHFTCWTGCFTHADIFDIVGKEYDLKTNNQGIASLPINLNIGKYKISAKFKEKESNNEIKIDNIIYVERPKMP